MSSDTDLRPGWLAKKREDGRVYWVNETTRQISQHAPTIQNDNIDDKFTQVDLDQAYKLIEEMNGVRVESIFNSNSNSSLSSQGSLFLEAIGQEMDLSDRGEELLQRLLKLTNQLRNLKEKASKNISRGGYGYHGISSQQEILLTVINDIAAAIALADGEFPADITFGKQGATRDSRGNIESVLGVSSFPYIASNETTILRHLQLGDNEETVDAAQSIIDICTSKNTQRSEEMLNKLRSSGCLQMLLYAFTRCSTSVESKKVCISLGKAISLFVTLEADDSLVLSKNVKDIFNVLFEVLKNIREKPVRSRTNSLSDTWVQSRLSRDTLGKAALSRTNSATSNITVSTTSADVSLETVESVNELKLFIAKALVRLSTSLTQEWAKMDQNNPILPPSPSSSGGMTAMSMSMGRSSSGGLGLTRNDSFNNDRNGRGRSSSNTAIPSSVTASEILDIFPKLLLMLCNGNGPASGNDDGCDDISFIPNHYGGSDMSMGNKYSPIVSPLSSPREFVAFSGENNSVKEVDILCCEALAKFANVPICLTALVEGGPVFTMIKHWMHTCISVFKKTKVSNLKVKVEIVNNDPIFLLAVQAINAVGNMMTCVNGIDTENPSWSVQNQYANLLDRKIVMEGVLESITTFIIAVIGDFSVPNTEVDILPITLGRPLALILHQLCSRHHRPQMVTAGVPEALVALFVTASQLSKTSTDSDTMQTNLDYLEYISCTCLDSLTYFLTDACASDRIEPAHDPEVLVPLISENVVQYMVYALSNLPRSKARLAALHVVSNLTQWETGLQALFKGDIVGPLVVIASQAQQSSGERTEKNFIKKLYRQDKNNSSSTSMSKMINTSSAGGFNNVEHPLYDFASSFFGFMGDPHNADLDNSIRSAKNLSKGPHSISNHDGTNPTIYFNPVNAMEETIIVCAALANIAHGSLEYAGLLYKTGLLNIMLQLNTMTNAEVCRQALRCVSAMCRIVPSKGYITYSKPQYKQLSKELSMQIEARDIREKLSVSTQFDPKFATDALLTLTEAINSDNSMLQNEAIWGVAGLAMNEDEIIIESIIDGPLQAICILMNSERDLVEAAEAVLRNCGFSGGKDDFALCTNDFSKLRDWFVMRRWIHVQELCYKSLDKWINGLFPDNLQKVMMMTNASEPVSPGKYENLKQSNLSTQGDATRTSSASQSPDSSGNTPQLIRSLSASPVTSTNDFDDLSTPRSQLQKSLSTGLNFLRRAADIESGRIEIAPWARGEKARHYASNIEQHCGQSSDISGPPIDVLNLQMLFYPSRLHKLFLLDLLILGCTDNGFRSSFNWDSDSSADTTSTTDLSRRKRNKNKEFLFSVPKHHEVYALCLPAQIYHEVLMTSLSKIIEHTINQCSVTDPARLFALAFANSSIEMDFIQPFLAFLGKTPQITSLTFQDTTEKNNMFQSRFQSSPREKNNGYFYYLGSHIPSSIRFLTFKGCLTSLDVQKLCGHLLKENAAFKGLRQNLYTRGTHGSDGYDSDASTTSHGSLQSHNAKKGLYSNAIGNSRWKYVKGLIGLGITGVNTLSNEAVSSICNMLSSNGRMSSSVHVSPSIKARKVIADGEREANDDGNENDDEYNDGENNALGVKGLKYLDLADNNLSDVQCAQLFDSATSGVLEGMELAGNIIKQGEAFTSKFVHVMNHKNDIGANNLRHLGLRGLQLSEHSICQMLDVLRENLTLTSLDIADNNLKSTCDLNDKLSIFIGDNRTMRSLDLSHNSFDSESTSMIEVGILSNNTLLLLPYRGNCDDAMSCLEFTGIQEQLTLNRQSYCRSYYESVQLEEQALSSKNKRTSSAPSVLHPRPVDISCHIVNGNQNQFDSNTSTDRSANGSPLTLNDVDDTVLGIIGAGTEKITSVDQLKAMPSFDSGMFQRKGLPIDSQWKHTSLNHDNHFDDRVELPSAHGQKYLSLLSSQAGYGGLGGKATLNLTEKVLHAKELEHDDSVASPRIESLSRQNSFTARKINTLHVLFAAPLALRDRSNNLLPAGKLLPYNKEGEEIKQVFEDVSRDVNVKFDFATSASIRSILTNGCRALHFSGHGHPNAVWLEDGCAGLQLMNKDTLLQLLRAGDDHNNIEFVFLAACHSETLASAWVELGVKHVVCVKVSTKIQDSASVVFTKDFYRALLNGKTVENAFNIGRQAVNSSPYVNEAERESKKFILLPENEPHDAIIFSRKEVQGWSATKHCVYGSSGHLSPGSKHTHSPPLIFEGRQVDVYRVILQISRNHLVTLVGEEGIGKTAIADAACTYMADRRMPWLEDGIVYLKERGVDTFMSFLTAIYNLLKKSNALSVALRKRINEIFEEEREQSDYGGVSTSLGGSGKYGGSSVISAISNRTSGNFHILAEQHRLSQLLLNLFKGDSKILLVLDHIDELLQSDTENLMVINFLKMLFQDCPNLKILIVCSDSINFRSLGVNDCSVAIKGLDLKNSLRLYSRWSIVLNTGADKERFVHEILSKIADQKDLTVQSRGITIRTATIFKALGDGHPTKLQAIASQSSRQDLKKLKEIVMPPS
jgi:hypothetical protein